MGRIPLISAAYAGQSTISSGQECVNLYAEINVKIITENLSKLFDKIP